MEFGDGGPEDAKVEVVAEVDPDGNEEAEVGADDDGVEVVECFGCLGLFLSARVGKGLCWKGERGVLTARKKSLISCVIYTAIPIWVKWNR